jgi:hypothetical protein
VLGFTHSLDNIFDSYFFRGPTGFDFLFFLIKSSKLRSMIAAIGARLVNAQVKQVFELCSAVFTLVRVLNSDLKISSRE